MLKLKTIKNRLGKIKTKNILAFIKSHLIAFNVGGGCFLLLVFIIGFRFVRNINFAASKIQVQMKTYAQIEEEKQTSAQKEMFDAARRYIVKNSPEGTKFNLELIKQSGKWVLFSIVYEYGKANDNLVRKRLEGIWQIKTLEQEIPEAIKEEMPKELFEP